MLEFPYTLLDTLLAIGKGLASWFLPFALVAYVATYFVMAIIFVNFWKQEQGPWIRPFCKKAGKRGR